MFPQAETQSLKQRPNQISAVIPSTIYLGNQKRHTLLESIGRLGKLKKVPITE